MVNIAEYIDRGELDAEIVCVVSSRSDVAGIERSRELGIEPVILRGKDFDTVEAFSGAISNVLKESGAELVLQCGWMCFWQVPKELEGKVMNIHPSLLPMFGGKGMYGHHVHEALEARGCKVSGCTVHFVTNEYDAGPIIVQKTCEIDAADDADAIAAKVFEQECLAYPKAIRLFGQGRLEIVGSKVVIK